MGLNNQDYLTSLFDLESPDATYWNASPALVLSSAKGSTVFDVQGNPYTDLCMGFGALALGHHHESYLDVLRMQLSDQLPPITHGLGDVYPSVQKIGLLEKLVSMLPEHLTKATLSLSGSQAIESAIKTAILATSKTGFIALQGGYHGLDLGVLPFTSREDFSGPFREYAPMDHVVQVAPHADKDEIKFAITILENRGHGFAGIIVEPIQGRAGIRPLNLSWLHMLREITANHKALLIFDEIFIGLGRAGRISFAELVPADIITLGKALGGGFPLSACVGTSSAMDHWPLNNGESIHTGTFFGHPLSCQVGKATLDTITNDNLAMTSKRLGERAKEFLSSSLKSMTSIKDVRGEGLFIAIEFNQDGAGATAMNELRKNGIIALASGERGSSLSLTPALNMDEAFLIASLEKVVETIKNVF